MAFVQFAALVVLVVLASVLLLYVLVQRWL
jgi:hypothetical protein